MATIKTKNNKVVLKNGKASCNCCGIQLTIKYDWSGTGMRDLDTQTAAFGESVGFACGGGGTYLEFVGGDNTGLNGYEQVNVKVDTAKTNGLWTSSYNIQCFAGWFTPAGGSGSAKIIVEYNGGTKNKSISPGSQVDCASTSVGTVTIYSTQQSDGLYFAIL